MRCNKYKSKRKKEWEINRKIILEMGFMFPQWKKGEENERKKIKNKRSS